MNKQREDNNYYDFLNKKILKFLKKYKKNYSSDIIHDFRNDIFLKLNNKKNKLPTKKIELDKYVYITCRNCVLDFERKKKENIVYTENNEFLENSLQCNDIDDNYIIPEHYNKIFKSYGETNYKILNLKKNGYNLNEISKLLNISRTKTYNLFKKINKNANI